MCGRINWRYQICRLYFTTTSCARRKIWAQTDKKHIFFLKITQRSPFLKKSEPKLWNIWQINNEFPNKEFKLNFQKVFLLLQISESWCPWWVSDCIFMGLAPIIMIYVIVWKAFLLLIKLLIREEKHVIITICINTSGSFCFRKYPLYCGTLFLLYFTFFLDISKFERIHLWGIFLTCKS